MSEQDTGGTAEGEDVETPDGEDTEATSDSEAVSDVTEEPAETDEPLSDLLGGEDTPAVERVEEIQVDEERVEAVAEADPVDTAEALAALQADRDALRARVEEEAAEREELESRLKRKQADFQNYKKRQEEKLSEVRERATEDLVERLLDVRDNLVRALDQDEDADIRGGVESTLAEFDRQLERENVSVIQPDPGEETEPTRHEVLMRVDSDQPEGTVDEVHRPGYEMAGKVLRAAQVTVSDG